jgi:Cu/Ag efflux protein CusF
MKFLLISAALALSLPLFVPTAQAQSTAPADAAKTREMVDAEVRKVDREGGKVTLKHAEMKSLDMPAMTMVFRVKDEKLWDRLTEGAKVKIAAEKAILGYNVVAVESAK